MKGDCICAENDGIERSFMGLIELETVDSTQDEARRLWKSGHRAVAAVRAEHQTSGRGRSGSTWEAPFGTCLLVTYIVPGPPLPISKVGGLAFAAALAVADAVEPYLDRPVQLKWPNDILIERRKLAGILVEAIGRSDDWAALVGIGINVNVANPAEELHSRAASLSDSIGRPVPIRSLERTLNEALFKRVHELRSRGLKPIIASWRDRDITIGTKFAATNRSLQVIGTGVGVTESGALVLEIESGERIKSLDATSLPDC